VGRWGEELVFQYILEQQQQQQGKSSAPYVSTVTTKAKGETKLSTPGA